MNKCIVGQGQLLTQGDCMIRRTCCLALVVKYQEAVTPLEAF